MKIAGQFLNNVVLFPKTEQFYEEELTRFLQREQYGEAVELLSFLLRFPRDGDRKAEQWEALLSWLQTMMPNAVIPGALSPEEEQETTEEEMLRQYVEEKASVDTAFVDKLLRMLRKGTLEQQLAALEQLGFVKHPEAAAAVREWLRDAPRHPILQFKALQALKHMGESGAIHLFKNGKHVFVEIEETPLCAEEFPAQIRDMIRRIADTSERNQPDFAFFAERTWQEFLAYAYGTPLYSGLLAQEEGIVDIWASALHAVLQEKLFGSADHEEHREMYGITDSMHLSWKQAYAALRKYLEFMTPEQS